MSVIEVKKLTKNFGSKKTLRGVSFEVKEGEIFGFLGPNGAGKTTTIRCLMDYIRPTSGSIKIFGKDARLFSAELKQDVGYLSSDMQLYQDWSGKEHIALVEKVQGPQPRAKELAKELDLDLSKKVRQLSSGNKQKLAIIMAFAGEPKLLIMDEPTRGLDPLLQNKLYQLLREFTAGGGTVFLSSHDLAEVQRICDAVLVIRQGSVVAAKTMAELRDLRIHVVEAVSTKPIDTKLLKIKGVEILHHNGHDVMLKVRGDINAVMQVLVRYDLKDLEVTHASLEDIFMEFYS